MGRKIGSTTFKDRNKKMEKILHLTKVEFNNIIDKINVKNRDSRNDEAEE